MAVYRYFPSFSLTLNNAPTGFIVNRVQKRQSLDCIKISSETDPACGSGGFLIQAFNHVNQKIINSQSSSVEQKKKFKKLIDKNIWGHEADKDLHVLAKINLIMHGDGWNNIYQGDT